MKILCFGDSNTYGYDPRSYLGSRYGEGIRWPGLLGALPGVEVYERGENGRCIPHRDYQLKNAGREIEACGIVDIILIMLGGNDLLSEPDYFAEDVAERMEEFLLHLKGLSCVSGTKILLVPPVPMIRGQWVTEQRLIDESARLPELYRELAAAFETDYMPPPEGPGILDFDGVHLTSAGHRSFFEKLKSHLEKYEQ